jgi:DNA-binding transcriptional MerR regulator
MPEVRRLYYPINEVSKITGVAEHTLRYWEDEFPQLKPARNRAGHRIYTNKDIELIINIKELLKVKKYTFEGARKVLDELKGDARNVKRKRKRSLAQSFLDNENEKSSSSVEIRKTKKVRSIQEDLLAIKEFLLFLRTKIE